jgi:hypothetical protein
LSSRRARSDQFAAVAAAAADDDDNDHGHRHSDLPAKQEEETRLQRRGV